MRSNLIGFCTAITATAVAWPLHAVGNPVGAAEPPRLSVPELPAAPPATKNPAGATEESRNSKPTEFVEWRWPVAIPESSDKEVQELAADLQKYFVKSVQFGSLRASKNPTCCLWLEISNWRPNPSQAGYVIIIQGGGGIVMASDHDQLKAAIEKLKSVGRRSKDHVEIPIGLMTNYQVLSGE